MSKSIGQIKISALTFEDHLEHHGIKGQKWGVRRFQNEDGTLKKPKKGRGESSTWKSKDAETLSDEELNRRNSRLQREKQYRELTMSKGQKFLASVKKNAGKILVATAVGVAAASMSKNYKVLFDAGKKYIAGQALNPSWMKINLSNIRK